jgi:hypothetical protein
MWLFFLWYGLANVLGALGTDVLMASPFPLIGGLLALAYAVLSVFNM